MLQLFAADDKKFVEQWRQPTPPHLTTTNSAVRNQPVFLMIIIGGCVRDADQQCDVVGDIVITDPKGARYGEYKAVPIFRERAGEGVLMLSPTSLGLRVEDGEALGRYRIELSVTDLRAKKTLRVFDHITVSEAASSKG